MTPHQLSAWKRRKKGLPATSTVVSRKARQDCIIAYGGKCKMCGLADHRCLTLDHVPRWARAAGYPPILQLLCWNCNFLKQKQHLAAIRNNSLAYQRIRRYNAILRATVLAHYGQSCRTCGEANLDFLVLCRDQKTRQRASGHRIYTKLRSLGFPAGFHVSCWNCLGAKCTEHLV